MGNIESPSNPGSAKPLRLRMRPDLVAQRQTYQGRDYWVIKDPLALKYYRFEEEEYAILTMLDGKTSADEIQYQFHQRFAPQKISLAEIFQLVGMLHRSALLLADAPAQGRELTNRADKARRRRRWAQWTNVLSFQIRGIDPDRWLASLNRQVGWFFSRSMLWVNLALALAAVTLMLTQWSDVQNRLPGVQEFFHASNWLWLAAILAVTKILHELGHGVCCKRMGGQCHEMGFMLLVLTPCLYVNVSDSWTLPSKWRRIAIAAAGMYVELVLASMCVFIWWFTQPGLVNQLALNTVVVCSISTVLFNANPLMKYDGYYMLSDWLEIPNLRQKSSSLFRRWFSSAALGMELPQDPFLPQRQRWLFVTYAIASTVYRWVITFAILYFLHGLLEPYGFQLIGQLLAATVVLSLLVPPIVGAFKFFSVPGRSSQMRISRAVLSAGILGAVLLGALLIPVPHHVYCSLYVQPSQSATVYVKAPGRIRAILAQPNQWVAAGAPILELANPDLDYELTELAGRADLARTRYRAAVQISNFDARFSGEVDTAEAGLASMTSLWEQRRSDREKLTVRAPQDGFLIAADHVAPDEQDGRLPNWHGRPLDQRNVGAHLLEGTSIGQIAPDPSQLEAVLAIDQGDIEFIAPDQSVELWVRQAPGQTFRSAIGSLSHVEMKSVPPCLSAKFGGSVTTTTSSDGSERPTSATYRVSVPIRDPSQVLLHGSSGTAKIRVGSRTLGSWLWRLVCQTVRFEL